MFCCSVNVRLGQLLAIMINRLSVSRRETDTAVRKCPFLNLLIPSLIWYSLAMRENWLRFFQTSVISAAVIYGAYPLFAEEETRESPKQQIYLSQMDKYPALSKEFSKEIEATARPLPTPSEGENLFLRQLEDYPALNTELADTFSKNVSNREVPADPEEIYLWQLEEYKELDKEFYHEHRGGF